MCKRLKKDLLVGKHDSTSETKWNLAVWLVKQSEVPTILCLIRDNVKFSLGRLLIFLDIQTHFTVLLILFYISPELIVCSRSADAPSTRLLNLSSYKLCRGNVKSVIAHSIGAGASSLRHNIRGFSVERDCWKLSTDGHTHSLARNVFLLACKLPHTSLLAPEQWEIVPGFSILGASGLWRTVQSRQKKWQNSKNWTILIKPKSLIEQIMGSILIENYWLAHILF